MKIFFHSLSKIVINNDYNKYLTKIITRLDVEHPKVIEDNSCIFINKLEILTSSPSQKLQHTFFLYSYYSGLKTEKSQWYQLNLLVDVAAQNTSSWRHEIVTASPANTEAVLSSPAVRKGVLHCLISVWHPNYPAQPHHGYPHRQAVEPLWQRRWGVAATWGGECRPAGPRGTGHICYDNFTFNHGSNLFGVTARGSPVHN